MASLAFILETIAENVHRRTSTQQYSPIRRALCLRGSRITQAVATQFTARENTFVDRIAACGIGAAKAFPTLGVIDLGSDRHQLPGHDVTHTWGDEPTYVQLDIVCAASR